MKHSTSILLIGTFVLTASSNNSWRANGFLSSSTTTTTTTTKSNSKKPPATRHFYQENSQTEYGYQKNIQPIQADQQTASLPQMNSVNIRPRGGQMVQTNRVPPQQQQQQQQLQLQPPPSLSGAPQPQGLAPPPQQSVRNPNLNYHGQPPQQQFYSGPTSTTTTSDQEIVGSSTINVQGGSRRTFYNEPHYTGESNFNHIHMQTEGRTMHADYELWEGPDYAPTRMKIYSEDGQLRPFHAVVENRGNAYTSSGYFSNGNVMSVRNAAPMELPLSTSISKGPSPYQEQYQQYQQQQQLYQDPLVSSAPAPRTASYARPQTTIQGGALRTWSYDHSVSSVQVTLTTDGLPMYALIEHWGVDGHVKQIAELYNENGSQRPFHATIATPGGSGDTIGK
jgi:hypothetical protein